MNYKTHIAKRSRSGTDWLQYWTIFITMSLKLTKSYRIFFKFNARAYQKIIIS